MGGAGTGKNVTDLIDLTNSADGDVAFAYTSSIDSATNNIVTFQGDLNYDGTVSLQDVAFMNAGGAAATAGADFADVDANSDGTIDMTDLAIIDTDWEQTLSASAAEVGGVALSTTLDLSGASQGAGSN